MFVAWGAAPPESQERLVVGKASSLRKLRDGWMELRLIASSRLRQPHGCEMHALLNPRRVHQSIPARL